MKRKKLKKKARRRETKAHAHNTNVKAINLFRLFCDVPRFSLSIFLSSLYFWRLFVHVILVVMWVSISFSTLYRFLSICVCLFKMATRISYNLHPERDRERKKQHERFFVTIISCPLTICAYFIFIYIFTTQSIENVVSWLFFSLVRSLSLFCFVDGVFLLFFHWLPMDMKWYFNLR